MGSSGSKPANNDALLLCKDRVKYMNQAIDSRFALSAAHLSYIQSLCSVGTALRQFAEAALLMESSISTSKLHRSPSHSSCASLSPSRFAEHASPPSLSGSPASPRLSNMSYMRAAGASVVTVTTNSLETHFVEADSLTSFLPPPQENGSSWDFFDPTNPVANCQLHNGESGQSINFSRRQSEEAEVVPLSEEEVMISCEKKQLKGNKVYLEGINEEFKHVNLTHKIGNNRSLNSGSPSVKGRSIETMVRIASSEISRSSMENTKLQTEIFAEREDASEFITHRAKCFLSSMRDIEYRFLRAAEAGSEISRMLETNKIRLGICSDGRGKPPSSQITSVFNRVCCKGEPVLKHGDSMQNVMKTITWNRSVSSLSSSSNIPLALAAKDDVDNTGSDFTEEFCMISGSHSSTLDRLYAWECKLYDEIKSNEYIKKVYDQKCRQLRNQCARDLDAGLTDKTRAIVKDLHSQLGVAIQSVESISKRIEKLRDDELQPQLVELVQWLIRMWKAMLECHHAQFITISLAYLMKSSTAATLGESYRQALIHLRNEMDSFSHSFLNWVSAYKSYVEALSTWLQKCVLQPQEFRKGRRVVFPPHQALSPPIFVLCNDWLVGLKSLPSKQLCDSVEDIMSILHDSFKQPMEDEQAGKMAEDVAENSGGFDGKEEQDGGRLSNLQNLKTGLTRLFDRLTKFSEASLKVHEDVKQGSELAAIAYANVVF